MLYQVTENHKAVMQCHAGTKWEAINYVHEKIEGLNRMAMNAFPLIKRSKKSKPNSYVNA